MTKRLVKSNGTPRRRQLRPPTNGVAQLPARWRGARYELSALGVAAACLLTAAGELAFSFPPLILLAAAVAAASSLFGPGPGLFALAAATLAGDYFFLHPKNTFSLDRSALWLGFYYTFAGLISYAYARRHRRRAAGRE